DRNRSHWSTSKTPSYTKSVSWQHHHFWQHKAPQKYSAFELAFELGHRVIAELILNTLNKMAESFGFTDNPRYIAEKNYMEALLKKASPHTVR
ncbi:hypothetical protein, partial [Escherichia coli]|uniref:hypothetical protein n=1 Tax=Escherichia coli TaxID=562 RepID=UPI002576FA3E